MDEAGVVYSTTHSSQPKIELNYNTIQQNRTTNHVQTNERYKNPMFCIVENCYERRKGVTDYCTAHGREIKILEGRIARQKAIDKIASRNPDLTVVETNYTVPETKNVPVSPTGIESILSLVLGIGLIVYSFTTGLENMWNPKYSPFSGCYTLVIGSLLVVISTRSGLLGLFVGFLMACSAIIYFGEVINSMPPLMR